MNRSKKYKKVISVTLCAALAAGSILPAYADEKVSKDENIYVNLEQDGSVSDIYVVNEYMLDEDTSIVDYGKYRYELARKEKEARKKQKTIDVKEVRLSPNIDTNDLKTKVNAARKFLSKGDRVKVTLRFRGREMAHMSSSKHVLDDFADLLSDIATVEKAPKVEGRSMTMFLTEKR